jgi:hypothetical protein
VPFLIINKIEILTFFRASHSEQRRRNSQNLWQQHPLSVSFVAL